MQRGPESHGARRDDDGRAAPIVICRIGERLCGVPLRHVIETMRPLTIEPLPNVPPFVLGLAVIRGEAVPVVDAALLLGGAGSRCDRFVTLGVGGRVVALAVAEVTGVRDLPASELEALPALVAESAGDVIAAIMKADADLVFVLRESRILDDSVWATIDERASA